MDSDQAYLCNNCKDNMEAIKCTNCGTIMIPETDNFRCVNCRQIYIPVEKKNDE